MKKITLYNFKIRDMWEINFINYLNLRPIERDFQPLRMNISILSHDCIIIHQPVYVPSINENSWKIWLKNFGMILRKGHGYYNHHQLVCEVSVKIRKRFYLSKILLLYRSEWKKICERLDVWPLVRSHAKNNCCHK